MCEFLPKLQSGGVVAESLHASGLVGSHISSHGLLGGDHSSLLGSAVLLVIIVVISAHHGSSAALAHLRVRQTVHMTYSRLLVRNPFLVGNLLFLLFLLLQELFLDLRGGSSGSLGLTP